MVTAGCAGAAGSRHPAGWRVGDPVCCRPVGGLGGVSGGAARLRGRGARPAAGSSGSRAGGDCRVWAAAGAPAPRRPPRSVRRHLREPLSSRHPAAAASGWLDQVSCRPAGGRRWCGVAGGVSGGAARLRGRGARPGAGSSGSRAGGDCRVWAAAGPLLPGGRPRSVRGHLREPPGSRHPAAAASGWLDPVSCRPAGGRRWCGVAGGVSGAAAGSRRPACCRVVRGPRRWRLPGVGGRRGPCSPAAAALSSRPPARTAG